MHRSSRAGASCTAAADFLAIAVGLRQLYPEGKHGWGGRVGRAGRAVGGHHDRFRKSRTACAVRVDTRPRACVGKQRPFQHSVFACCRRESRSCFSTTDNCNFRQPCSRISDAARRRGRRCVDSTNGGFARRSCAGAPAAVSEMPCQPRRRKLAARSDTRRQSHSIVGRGRRPYRPLRSPDRPPSKKLHSH